MTKDADPTQPNKTRLDNQKLQAEIAKLQAETLIALHEAEGQQLDNIMATALGTTSQIAVEREQRKLSWEKASDGYNRVLHFTDDVTIKTATNAIDVISRWHRIDNERGNPTRPYSIVLCTGGGDVFAGVKLYSVIQAIAQYRPILTVASGVCASMGTIIHQAGTHRLIEPGCSYLIHEISGGMGGTLGSMRDTTEWMTKLNQQLYAILAIRSTLTEEEIMERSKRRDFWLVPEEVIEMGFADQMGYGI